MRFRTASPVRGAAVARPRHALSLLGSDFPARSSDFPYPLGLNDYQVQRRKQDVRELRRVCLYFVSGQKILRLAVDWVDCFSSLVLLSKKMSDKTV